MSENYIFALGLVLKCHIDCIYVMAVRVGAGQCGRHGGDAGAGGDGPGAPPGAAPVARAAAHLRHLRGARGRGGLGLDQSRGLHSSTSRLN